ncbi:MAG: DNA transposition protein, partial [Arcobacteraceae bacterium]|nr:DNA transposition protein [Arcobacteraceae bacterium]
MREFTEKELTEFLNVSQQALNKALKDIPYIPKDIDNSTKKVKHYKYEDLPERYKDKLKEVGIEDVREPSEDSDTNILKAKTSNFTKKYLLADPKKQKQAVLRCRLVEFYLKKDP